MENVIVYSLCVSIKIFHSFISISSLCQHKCKQGIIVIKNILGDRVERYFIDGS